MKNKTYLEIKFSPTRLKQIQKIALSGSRAKLKLLNGKFEEGFTLLQQSAKKLKSFAIDLSEKLPLTLAGQVSLKLFSYYEMKASKKLGIPKGIVLGGVLALMTSLPVAGQTITVVNTNDAGAGSLRQAIIDANANSAAGSIRLADGATYTILSNLPTIANVSTGGTLQIICTGSTNAIIDGAGLHRPITMDINSDLRLSKITVQNGFVANGVGGGIYNNGGALTISNSIITNNEVTGTVPNGRGGGIHSTGQGGAALVLIQNSTISLNSATVDGGGIFNANNSTLTISSSTISNNQASGNVGGGVLNKGSNMTIQASSILYNQSNQAGGGVYIQGNGNNTTSTIENTTISNNTSTGSSAGGVFHKNLGGGTNTFNLRHVTISDNTSSGGTAGFNAATDGGTTANFNIENTIIANSNTPNDLIIGGLGTNNIAFQKSIVENTVIVDIEINNTNPLLAPLTLNSGFLVHPLQSGSPAIAAGANIGIATDQLGNPRTLASPFIGAVEVLEPLVSCPITVLNTNDAGAGSLRQAILDANANPTDCTIYLTAGTTYTISSNLPIVTGTDIGGELTIRTSGLPNAIIDGNNAHRPITMVPNSDLTLSNITIQNGFVNGNGGAIHNNRGSLTLSNSIITNNQATGTNPNGRGGGIFSIGTASQATSVLIQNATISLNSATFRGGGIFNTDNSTLTILSSSISGNQSTGRGGGIFNEKNSLLTISTSTISGNTSNTSAAGVYNNSSNGLISNSYILGNASTLRGGGLVNSNNSTLTIVSSSLSGNIAKRGGGLANFKSTLTINDSFVSNNQAVGASSNGIGAGIYSSGNGGTAFLIIQNSIISINSASQDGGGIFNFYNSPLTISSSTISGNTALRGGGIYNYNSNLTLTSSTITNNQVTGGSPYGVGAGIYSQGNGGSTIFVRIENSTISFNSASRNGAGIFNKNHSNLSILSSSIVGNTANEYAGGISNTQNCILSLSNAAISSNISGDRGGGIFNFYNSPLTISSSTISNNRSNTKGGGIWSNNSDITIQASSITLNSATHTGGGMYVNSNGGDVLNIINTTISSNRSITSGGGIYAKNTGGGNTLNLQHVTISDNSGAVTGGFANNGGIDITIENSIIANSIGVDFDLGGGTLSASTNNIVEDGTMTVGAIAVDPKLDVLQVFSGSLLHPLLFGSPAMNAGLASAITSDQVGSLRIGLPDIGAFENVGSPCFVVNPPPSVTTIWLGCVNSNWNEAGNWSTGAIPTSSDVILIPTFSPTLIVNTNAFCKKIISQKGTKYYVTKGNKIFFN